MQRRVMNMGGHFEIQEKNGKVWESVHKCRTIEDAKQMLKTLKTLEEDAKNE